MGVEFNRDYKAYAVSQTDVVFANGSVGRVGDVLDRIVIQVTTAATSACTVKDGSGGSAIPLVVANTPVGTYSFHIGIRAKNTTNPGLYITTGAGVTLLAVGKMSG